VVGRVVVEGVGVGAEGGNGGGEGREGVGWLEGWSREGTVAERGWSQGNNWNQVDGAYDRVDEEETR
jgi:hypothetical protein